MKIRLIPTTRIIIKLKGKMSSPLATAIVKWDNETKVRIVVNNNGTQGFKDIPINKVYPDSRKALDDAYKKLYK